ncbi:MAG: DNA/RNA non-specific endonuclease [Chitinophagaceae bacterium]
MLRVVFILMLQCSILVNLCAQNVDTVINTGTYKSYFSFGIKAPLYVTYTLFRGGGSCNRKKQGFYFKQDAIKTTSKSQDYTNSTYQKGHLANAEDFAFDCLKAEITFRFYNCFPQTARLNNGTWKYWENQIRKESQKRKLFIIAGGIYSKSFIGLKVGVPDYCYKIVLESATKKILYCLIFKNDNSNKYTMITLKDLKARLKYPLIP